MNAPTLGEALERNEDGGTGWRFVHPEIEALRQEFKAT